MNKIQELIVRENQRIRKMYIQNIILITQFLYSVTWIIIAAHVLNEKLSVDQQFKLFYISLPNIIAHFGIDQIIIQSMTLCISFAFFFSAISGGKFKLAVRIVDSLWDIYPNIIQLMIIQNSGYCLFIDDVNFGLGVVNIITTLLISQSISLYSFFQNDSQILIKSFLERYLIPLNFSILALLAGLQQHNSQISYVYLGLQISVDNYYGFYYYKKPHVYYLNLKTTKLAILMSFIRFSLAGSLLCFQGNQLILLQIFIVPFMIHLHLTLWDKRFIEFIYKSNVIFQYICLDKYRQWENIDIDGFIAHYLEVINYKKPLNRIFMLGIFCNHMNMCQNMKCFCINKYFYDNVQVQSKLQNHIDMKSIIQEVNYLVGEKEIEACYKQLILLLFDNITKNTRYTIIGESASLKQSLYELKYFKGRLFQTKLRFSFLKIYYPQLHPQQIERRATLELISKELQYHIGGVKSEQFNISMTLNYFSLLSDIKHKIYQIIDEKVKILEVIRRNYQNSLPYYLDELNKRITNQCQILEQQIHDAINLNGQSLELRDIQNDFYTLVKYDYNHKNKLKDTQLPFINQNITSFVMCQYESDLIIKQYSNNFLEMLQLNKSIKDGVIEQIVPVILQQYHKQAIKQMIKTGETKLVNKEQYALLVKSENYIVEVDALLRLDLRQQQSLNFIGFVQQRDKDSILILANENGRIDSFTKKAGKLLKLDFVDVNSINYFYLSPNLLQKLPVDEFDGLILIPKKSINLDYLSYYKYYIAQPNECYLFIINGKNQQIIYSSITIYSLKITQCYQLKEYDLKIFALDLMIRQVMLQTKTNNSQYILPLDSIRKMETIKKNFQTIIMNNQEDLDQWYNLSNQDDSERFIRIVPQSKTLIPEFITSIDSIRTSQDKLLIKKDQFKDYFYQNQSKERSFEQQIFKQNLQDFNQKSEQDIICKLNQQQVIDLELNLLDDQNIEVQIQQIFAAFKKIYTRNNQNDQKYQIKHNYQATAYISSTNSKNSQRKLIKNIVNQFQNTKSDSLQMLRLFSVLLILINIGFITGFIMNTNFELEKIQTDSDNQTYPLLLFQDFNTVLLGIVLKNLNSSYQDIGQDFITVATDQYKNISIWINDKELDYHLFLQELDKEEILIKEEGVIRRYKKKYLIKNYMIEKLFKIKELYQISITNSEAQFLFINYPQLQLEFWNLKNLTTYDVQQRISVLNQISQILLTLSIIINLMAIMAYFYILIHIIKWRNMFYSKIFLFNNLQFYLIELEQMIRKASQSNETQKKQQDEERNNNLLIKLKGIGVLIFFFFVLISLGFYIPIFIYIDQINQGSIDVNKLQTELTLMQLKQSSTLTWYFINQTEIKYNETILSGNILMKELIEFCTSSEDFILYNLPFDSKYDFFPEIQLYSSNPLCNCSLLDGQLMNGYHGFQSYVTQHLTDFSKHYEIIQAYQIVFDYQIKTRDKLNILMEIRLQSTQQKLITILMISIAIILVIQGSMLIAVYLNYSNLLKSGQQILFLFSPQLIESNKYLLQILIQNSSSQ